MPRIHRTFLIVSLAAGSLALIGCQQDNPAGEWTRSDRFDGGVYPGEHTRSDLDAGSAPTGDGGVAGDRSGADSASDVNRSAADADNRARLGQETGVNTGAGADRSTRSDGADSTGGRTGGTGGSGGTGR